MVYINSLNLSNYRNHKFLNLDFHKGLNLIVGGNAQGKTNILEAVYFLGRGRSFRTNDPKELIHWDYQSLRIEATHVNESGKNNLVAYVDNYGKTFKKDGKKKRSGVGLNVILFVPGNISIFRDSPKERRCFLDEVITGLDSAYCVYLREYVKVLMNRNRLLKKGLEFGFNSIEKELVIWTDQLVDIGLKLVIKRKEWIGRINRDLSGLYKYMGGVGENVEVKYLPDIDKELTGEDAKLLFCKNLEAKASLERIRGITLVGPHRDDWAVFLKGMDMKSFASQGQMRVMALTLKVAELNLHNEIFNSAPILMLDDVISELDFSSTTKLIKFVSLMKGQVFITTTNEESFIKRLGGNPKIFCIENSNL